MVPKRVTILLLHECEGVDCGSIYSNPVWYATTLLLLDLTSQKIIITSANPSVKVPLFEKVVKEIKLQYHPK
jgi:hypothetical protein